MSDTSNPTTRVLGVLSLLAAHPTETFTLAEISRRLGLSKATTHRILSTMTDARFLSRHPAHKTFSLGVAPVAIGEAALEKHRGIDIARREITRLALELNVQCTLSTLVDNDTLLLAKAGTPQSHAGHQRVGERTPAILPVGIAPIAWAGERAIAAYMAKVDGHLSEPVRAHLREALPLIRRRGYSTAVAGPAISRLRQTMILPPDRPRDERYWASLYRLVGELSAAEIQVFDFRDAGPHSISHIAAPVFSPGGTVAFELLISGMPLNLGADAYEDYAERLKAAASVVTGETHGRMPSAAHPEP